MGALTAFNYTYLPQFDTNINNGKLAYQQLWATLSFYSIQRAGLLVCAFCNIFECLLPFKMLLMTFIIGCSWLKLSIKLENSCVGSLLYIFH